MNATRHEAGEALWRQHSRDCQRVVHTHTHTRTRKGRFKVEVEIVVGDLSELDQHTGAREARPIVSGGVVLDELKILHRRHLHAAPHLKAKVFAVKVRLLVAAQDHVRPRGRSVRRIVACAARLVEQAARGWGCGVAVRRTGVVQGRVEVSRAAAAADLGDDAGLFVKGGERLRGHVGDAGVKDKVGAHRVGAERACWGEGEDDARG